MPDQQRRTQCAAGVPRRRLNPNPVEETLAKNPAVGYAIQRHTAGQAQIALAGFFADMSRHAKEDFLGNLLDRSRQIHVALSEFRLRFAGRAAEQPLEFAVGHGKTNAVVEIAHVQTE